MGATASDAMALADLTGEERAAAEELLFRLADDEFVLAERYTEWQVVSPTLESDLALSNIAQDELGHARIWYDALGELGYTEQALVWERAPEEFRHATLVELPFETGAWADPILRGYCFDVAEALRLDALRDGPVRELVDPLEKIEREEAYHRDHAEEWLERLAADADGRAAVQTAADRLFPHALALFVPGEHEETIRELGLRSESLGAMRDQWLATVGSFLAGLDVSVPMEPGDDPDAHLPEAVGRDGTHTEHWPALHEEYTRTYRDLDRSEVRRLRGDAA